MPTDLTNVIAPERNRYFYGLMMDAERFQKDQDYFNRKRFLLNRFVTGGGVVCGLGLKWNASTLTLSPGIAIDFAGREVIVPGSTTIDVTQLTDAQGNATGAVPAGSTIIISLAYAEQKIDDVPVLVPDCDNPGACSPSTIEEDFVILVRVATAAPVPPSCIFGTLPLPPGAALQTAIANQVANSYGAAPTDPSVPLGRLDLASNTLDAVSDRPIVYNNPLLYQLFFCLAGQVPVSGTNASNITGSIDGLYPASGAAAASNGGNSTTGPVSVSALLTAGTFRVDFDISPGANPFNVEATCPGGSATISINPGLNSWQATYTVPKDPPRTGDFSGDSVVTDFETGAGFAGNIIPSVRLDPLAVQATNALPNPNAAIGTGPNGTWSASGTLPAGGHFSIGTGSNPGPNFGGFINLISQGPQSVTFTLLVDGQLVASKDVAFTTV